MRGERVRGDSEGRERGEKELEARSDNRGVRLSPIPLLGVHPFNVNK